MYFNENISKKKLCEKTEKVSANTLPNEKNTLNDKE
jgi:hypothetical protein